MVAPTAVRIMINMTIEIRLIDPVSKFLFNQ